MGPEYRENVAASIVDIISIGLAYNLGLHQLNWWVGMAYAGLDAYVVIWQKKRVTRLFAWVFGRIRESVLPHLATDDRYLGRIRWR